MRKINLLYFLLISVFSIILINCSEDGNDQIVDAHGKIEFSAKILDSINKNYSKSKELDEVKSAIVTIINDVGEIVYESEKISFYKFSDVYITEPISLLTGNYILTSFYMVNESDSVLYAAPIEASSMAYLVDKPLPISFSVNKDEITTVSPEVLAINGYQPEDFGYASFGLNHVGIFDFLLTIFKYNPSIENFELTDADILITSGDDTLYNNSIGAITNKITLQDEYDVFNVCITKAGFNRYANDFSLDSLKSHYSNPLTIILETVDLEKGMLAYYPFDGDTYDYSGYENHATNYGAVLTSDRFGNVNSAYDFDGLTNYMQLSKDINFTNGLTFTFWINSNGPMEGEYNGVVIGKYDMASQRSFVVGSFGYGTDNSINKIKATFYKYNYTSTYRDNVHSDWTISNLPEGYNSEFYDFNSPTELSLNEWNFAVVNTSEEKLEIWINGILTVSKLREYDAYADDSTEPIYIGNVLNLGEGSNNHLNGALDELRIYNRALTSDEIQALYHEGGWDE